MSAQRLREAREDAHREAAPFAIVDLVALLLLAFLSHQNDWELLGTEAWWLWLLVALPVLALAVRFAVGIGNLERESGRAFSIWLLQALGLGNAFGVFALIASLTGIGGGSQPSGGQLLASGSVVLLTNVVTFAFAFWELDLGGPVARALADDRKAPDFEFPQDDNPDVARPAWEPRLWDYAYVALTNATAFSPTDVMPLTRRAKLVMAIESTVSIITVLVIAARAVNVLK
ncbi:MAG TPA: hypothetical protein VF066_11540 [Thermoleophilaceae bacterium]